MSSALGAPGFEWESKEPGWFCIFLTPGAPCAPCPSIHLGYLTSSFPLWVAANSGHLSLAQCTGSAGVRVTGGGGMDHQGPKTQG